MIRSVLTSADSSRLRNRLPRVISMYNTVQITNAVSLIVINYYYHYRRYSRSLQLVFRPLPNTKKKKTIDLTTSRLLQLNEVLKPPFV